MHDETNSAPTVSIIIPTHNRFKMLEGAVRSILDQTYRDYEIIIVDDASSDNTSEILERNDDSRIFYVRHEYRKGGSASRNTGISHARGEYIAFLDDDDEWLPRKLELQIKKFQEKPDVDVVTSGYIVRDNKSGEFINIVLPRRRGYIYNDLLWNNTISTCTVLIRRSALGELFRFDPELPRLQDWDMWLQIANNSLFDYIEEPLVLVNVHDNNRISDDTSASLTGRIGILRKYWMDISDNNALLSKHYLRVGSAYCQLGSMKDGRYYLKKSIFAQPYNIGSIVAFLFSLLGCKAYNYVVEAHRKLRYQYTKYRVSYLRRPPL